MRSNSVSDGLAFDGSDETCSDDHRTGVTHTMKFFPVQLPSTIIAMVLALWVTSSVSAQQPGTKGDSRKAARDPLLAEIDQAIEMSARRRLDADIHTP